MVKREFACGCWASYEKGDAMVHEGYCSEHTKVWDQKVVGKDGFVATGKVNLDTMKMKVIVSTAKQQLARHNSYPKWITSGESKNV